MKDTSNNAIIELARKAGVLQPEREQDNGYRYFTLNNSEYAIYPDRKNDYLFRVQNPENVEVNASQRENIVNGLERKLSLDSSNNSSHSTTPEKSTTISSSSDEDLSNLLDDVEHRRGEINGLDKSIEHSEKSIQHSEKSIQQVTEWGKKELERLKEENDKSNKRWEEYNNIIYDR